MTFASDSFNRTVATGWGNADVGGVYDASGGAASSYHVAPGLGTMVVPAGDGSSHLGQLADVSARDVDVHVQVQIDRSAAGDSQNGTVVVRRASGNTEYRFRIRYLTNGSVGIQALKVVFSFVIAIGSEVVVPGLTATPNVPVSVHFQAVGANPTTLRMNAWANGQTEPAGWQYSVVDSTTDLQEAGMVGLGATVGAQSTVAPVTFGFSNYLVQSVGPPPNVIWKPYLDQVGPTSAIVQWATYAGANPQVKYSTDTSYSATTTGTSRTLSVLGYQLHTVFLTGLQPSTAYFYKINNDGTDELPAETLSFSTAPPTGSAAPFTFLSFGDFGSNSATQKQLRDRMLQDSFTFLLTLGDNGYPNGTYQNFNANVFPVYRDIFDRAAQFSTLGNHDVNTGNGGPELDLFTLPQTALKAADQERYYSFDWGNAHFVVLDSNGSLTESPTDPTSMYAWLRNDLAQTAQPWKIVSLHHPPYSASGNTPLAIANLVPIFEQYGVDLVLSGHLHDYERTYPLKQGAVTTTGQGGIVYLVSGSGDSDSHSCVPVSWEAFQLCQTFRGNYSRISLNNSQITLQQVDYAGTVVDSFSWSKSLPTATVTSTPTTTSSPTNSATPTITATATDTPTATNTPTITPTFTMTPTSAPTDTATITPTASPSNTPTDTPTTTASPTVTPTPSDTATSTPTPTLTPTGTPTPSSTPTNTPTPTNSVTNTPTPSNTATSTPTPSTTSTRTPTSTNTATSTPTNSPTPSSNIIFADGFETGSFANWTATTLGPASGSVLSVVPSAAFSGSFGAHVSNGIGGAQSKGSYVSKNLTVPANHFIDAQTRIKVNALSGAGTLRLFQLRDSVTGLAVVRVRYVNGVAQLFLYRRDLTQVSTNFTTNLSTGSWHLLELKYDWSGSQPVGQAWVDGVLQAQIIDPSSGTTIAPNTVFCMVYEDVTTASADVYFDDVQVTH